jgi:hypothetical protein
VYAHHYSILRPFHHGVVTNVLFDLRDLKVIEGNNEKYISLGTPADGENYKVTNPPELKKLHSGSGFINMVPEPKVPFFRKPVPGKMVTYFFLFVKLSKLCLCFNNLHWFLSICC